MFEELSHKMNIYLDQNIIGYLYDGAIKLPVGGDFDWVYSNEHFNEISRGENTAYLEVLKELRARQVQLILDENFKITEQAQVHEYSCPFERYNQHLETMSEVEFDDSLYTGILGRLFGGDNFEKIRSLHDDFKIQVEQLLSPHVDLTPQFQDLLQTISSDLSEMIETQFNQTRSLENIRRPLGTSNGRVGNPKSDNPILEIWDIINCRYPGQNIDQFFGFDPIEKQNYDKWPTYLGIVGCHTILNIVGYRTDKGISNPANVKNIMSDASHIAHAAYCNGLMSEDRRFCDKASAIYKYRNIGTKVIRVSFEKNG